MQHTSETHETYGCNTYAHLLVALQWRLVDVEFDAGPKLKVAQGQQTDRSWPRWKAREARGMDKDAQHGDARRDAWVGPVRKRMDGHLESIIIVMIIINK
jgi:hypothetical protein